MSSTTSQSAEECAESSLECGGKGSATPLSSAFHCLDSENQSWVGTLGESAVAAALCRRTP